MDQRDKTEPQFLGGNFSGDFMGEFTVVPYARDEVDLIIDETEGSTMLTLCLERSDVLDLIAALNRALEWLDGQGPTEMQRTALMYAVKKNKGQLKVSSIKNHVVKEMGRPPMSSEDVHAFLAGMVHDGYLTKPEKYHQCYVWTVTDKGREAVE